MSKNKLQKFAEMETLQRVYQCTAKAYNAEGDTIGIAGRWRTECFKNDKPIVLELGCGRGEYTVGLAEMFSEKNFIGVDIKGARMWAGAKQANEQGLLNAAFLRTNIEYINNFFLPNEVDEIWITFPDPQMKKATKRLTSTFFLRRYEQLLKDGGIIHLKTDSPFLYTYTSELVRINNLEVLFETDDLYASDFNDPVRSLKTHYEHQWIERGLTIKLIEFRLPHGVKLKEPEIEIEKDTYRSYGRNRL